MSPRLHPLIAFLCALCLLGAQQAANAHFIGHIGTAAESTAFHKGGKSGNGSDAPALDGVCATCAAFAALVAAPPVHVAPQVAARTSVIRMFVQAPVFVPAPLAPPYASRAPPAVL